MPDILPLKLTDLGGGAGRLEELTAGDKLPASILPPPPTLEDIGAEAAGSVAAHVALADPHTQYAMAADVLDALETKVDKVTGKQLSTEDYTSAEKSKLAALATVASSGSYADLSDKPSIPSTPGDVGAATAAQGTSADTAYGWGNHASVGYLVASAIGVTVQAYSANLTAWAALATSDKQNTLVSGTNIKTINGQPVLGAGDLVIESGAGLTLFEESRNTESPNATVPVHALTAIGAETNIDFVIAPKGTGAIVAQVPNGTAVGGNKRGAGAVDLQTSRSSATQVASGQRSVAMGSNCTASGVRSVAMGSSCTASSTQSVAMGSNSIASGIQSVAIGNNCIANGTNSVAMGNICTTRGVEGATSEGNSTTAVGRQQMERIPLRFDTATSVPTQLTSNGSTPATDNSAVMPNNSAYYCRVRVLARNTSTNESMSWSGTALIKRGANAASTTLIGSTIASDFGDAAMSTCTVTMSANTTLGCLAVTVTGLASTTVRWVAQLETVEAA